MDFHRGVFYLKTYYMIYKYIMSVNKVFVDTRKFAIDRDFKNAISTLTLFQDFYNKKGIQSTLSKRTPL